MTNSDDNLDKIFNAPICPTCATIFDAQQYDDVDDCAYCSTCGTRYRIPDACRPPHPEDALEYADLDEQQTATPEAFKADAKRDSDEMMQATGGGTYEMYERRITEACEPQFDGLDPALRPHAIAFVRDLGYIDDPEALAAGFGPGLCALTGIEEHCCHCGRHE